MNYMTAIQQGFPNVICHSIGIDDTYESIVWDSGSPLPDKATLDQYILANQGYTGNRHLTIYAFRKRFTVSEKINIDLAGIDDPTAPIANRQLAARIRVLLKDMEAATYIDLSRIDIIEGVQLLEQNQLIGAGRATVILDSPVLEIERPTIEVFK